MLRNGLLVLSTSNVHCGGTMLSGIIESCVKTVCNLLYVHLVNCDISLATDSSAKPTSFGSVLCTQSVRHFISSFYTKASAVQQSLEIRFLLSNICSSLAQSPVPSQQRLQHGYEVVLTDLGHELHQAVTKYVATRFPVGHDVKVIQVPVGSNICQPNFSPSWDTDPVVTYPAVCLGGTFDYMHVGHRVLLSEACLLATQSLTVGVTDGATMHNKKILNELMQPIGDRLDSVRQFVSDIKPSLQYSIVPITDPFGPAVTDSQLECIVVSTETVCGANSINVKRTEQDMKMLEIQVIDLVDDSQHATDEEKISSSAARKQLLGTLLRPPLKERTLPYVVGLTGSTASGKSSVCARLERLGAVIIDCDKLGHKSYEPGTPTYQQLLSAFGCDLVTSSGHIDRKRLANRVFSHKEDLDKLNGIVWPAIRQLAQKEIANAGHNVVVLDAAVLLEAGWDGIVHEVWTTVIPLDEAVRRLVERNGITEEEALKRLRSQMSNKERVNRANVVLCTLWHPDVTQQQVEKAWQLLQNRLK